MKCVLKCYKLKEHFPNFQLSYDVNQRRQSLIDCWPCELNQTAAINDWGWKPKFDFDKAFDEYLIPSILDFYSDKD